MELILGRNSELNEKIKEERREQILANGLKLFATKGLAATKIADISKASGISQGLIYHYYKSKEAVFVELIKVAFEKMNEAVLALESLSLPPAEKIKAAIKGLLKNLEESDTAALNYLLIAQSGVSEAIPAEAKAVLEQEQEKPYEAMARIMGEGQKDGSIKPYDPEELAMIFWTSIKGIALHKATRGEKFKAPNPDILINTFLRQP